MLKISPPPTYITDVSDEMWKRWFSDLFKELERLDTYLSELEGGTTGQLLTKTSNADYDFDWVNSP